MSVHCPVEWLQGQSAPGGSLHSLTDIYGQVGSNGEELCRSLQRKWWSVPGGVSRHRLWCHVISCEVHVYDHLTLIVSSMSLGRRGHHTPYHDNQHVHINTYSQPHLPYLGLPSAGRGAVSQGGTGGSPDTGRPRRASDISDLTSITRPALTTQAGRRDKNWSVDSLGPV